MGERAASPTQLLLAWGSGETTARDALVPLVQDELRRLARHYMSHERANHTLQPTALVNEAYLRLVQIHKVEVARPGALLRRGRSRDASDPGRFGPRPS